MTGVLRRLDSVHGGAVRRVGHVDDHPQLVHPPDDLHAELAEAAVVALEDAVADVGLAAVGQPRQAYPRVVEHVHPVQLVADGQVLHRRQEPHLVLLLGRLDLGGAAYVHERRHSERCRISSC